MTDWDFIMNRWDFHEVGSRFYYEPLRFSWRQVEIILWTVKISIMTGLYFITNVEIAILTDWDFVTNSWDFHDGKSRFYYKRSKCSPWQVQILSWTVEIFIMTGQDFISNGWHFHDDRWRFYNELLRFSWWQFEIFIIDGLAFHDDKSIFFCQRLTFSWWQVQIFLWKVKFSLRHFISDDWYFHNDSSRFSWWEVDIISIAIIFNGGVWFRRYFQL